MNFSAAELRGPKRTPLPNPLPFGRGEGEDTPRSLSALIQRQRSPALSSSGGEGDPVACDANLRILLPTSHSRPLRVGWPLDFTRRVQA